MEANKSLRKSCVLSTTRGSLKGIEHYDTSGRAILRRYCRVRYARAPVGNLRWRRPQPPPSDWTFNDESGLPGDYTEFGAVCPQPHYDHSVFYVEESLKTASPSPPESEDCLFLNIWVPIGKPPPTGWPVQFHIHGGFLQVGTANLDWLRDPTDLLSHAAPRIIVSPTYRLNLFGFLAGSELAEIAEDPSPGNYGFWDQREALRWVHENIKLFHGNPNNITVGGLSAGAYSAFYQLYYDIHQPPSERLIKRAYLWSNAVAVQPPAARSSKTTFQFSSLCDSLGIPSGLTTSEKIVRLRALPSTDLVRAIARLPYHVFRACTDGSFPQGGFVPPSFLLSLHDGSFATRMASQGIKIMLGEVRDEAVLYKSFHAPDSRDALVLQLCNDYPRGVVEALINLPMYKVPADPNSPDREAWAHAFAKIRADMQVHVSLRGLTHCLLDPPEKPGIVPLPKENIFRYRIDWRAKVLDAVFKPSCGVFHSADIPIWWCTGYSIGYTAEDRLSARAISDPFGEFASGSEDIGWGGDGSENTLRYLDECGKVWEGWVDPDWERGMVVWNAVSNAQKGILGEASRQLDSSQQLNTTA